MSHYPHPGSSFHIKSPNMRYINTKLNVNNNSIIGCYNFEVVLVAFDINNRKITLKT
jgi:hypothetical protein